MNHYLVDNVVKPGDNADFKNKDIAMVKLGFQYEYTREKTAYKPWEKKEDDLLKQLVADSDDHEKEFKKNTVRDVTEADQNLVSLIHLEKKNGVLLAGTSGCPILAKKEEASKYTLAGLHFSGDKDDKDGKAYALPWNESIQSYIRNGTIIIANTEAFFGNKKLSESLPGALKETERIHKTLKESATENKLTVYLFDGTMIN
ncbi:hypothetical protein AWC38_SpisGene16621 [Stylophora pistillata]|uniref:Uncharacterized protein n=1 Tax=Stylophora pistillata TaxID=50429 RepID=A0A2B4RRL8_STYPI|nr:hypothetical protein AWC38_SpisGene16621 [Stylophora pistillata]